MKSIIYKKRNSYTIRIKLISLNNHKCIQQRQVNLKKQGKINILFSKVPKSSLGGHIKNSIIYLIQSPLILESECEKDL